MAHVQKRKRPEEYAELRKATQRTKIAVAEREAVGGSEAITVQRLAAPGAGLPFHSLSNAYPTQGSQPHFFLK